MSEEVWFRGRSTAQGFVKAGTGINDYGDGVYWSDRRDVAQSYADKRALDAPGTQQVSMVAVSRPQLGRVLDVYEGTNLAKLWNAHLDSRPFPNAQPLRAYIQRQNDELHFAEFSKFLKNNGVKLADYDAVIGPELVRGGRQLCILHKDGSVSATALRIFEKAMVIVGSGPAQPPRPVAPPATGVGSPRASDIQRPTPGRVGVEASIAAQRGDSGYSFTAPHDIDELTNPTTGRPFGRIVRTAARSRAGAAAFAAYAEGAFAGIRDRAIMGAALSRVQRDYSQFLEAAHKRGDGVLVIIHIAESNTRDENGFHGRYLQSVFVESGFNEREARDRWFGIARLSAAPPSHSHTVTETVWVDPW